MKNDVLDAAGYAVASTKTRCPIEAPVKLSLFAPDPTAVSTWTEERMLELATSLPAMRTIRQQPRGLRQRVCTLLKRLLQRRTNCNHQSVRRRDSESLQADLAAARLAGSHAAGAGL